MAQRLRLLASASQITKYGERPLNLLTQNVQLINNTLLQMSQKKLNKEKELLMLKGVVI